MLWKKNLRTIWENKAQFFSMILMVALGVGIFVGMNMEWYSIETDTSKFYEETGYADYRVTSENGITEEDLEAIKKIDGVDDVSRFFSANVEVQEEKGDTLTLTVTENEDVSGFIVNEGQAYDAQSTDGIWLSEKYADANNIKIGDPLTLEYGTMTVEGTVVGLIQSGEYLVCVRDESQLMPDYSTHGYAYVSPKMVDNLPFYQVHIISNLSKEKIDESLDDIFDTTVLLLTKEESISYSGSQGEIEEGQTMGSILPVLFLLIGILTMITTLHRLVLRERTQIGTLKALGFKDSKIVWHYSSYALLIGVFGSILGVGIGYLIAYMIIRQDGSMGTYMDMPYWDLVLPTFAYYVIVGVLMLLLAVGYLSVRSVLKENAADTLRNAEKVKRPSIWIERMKWFHRLSFGSRWNLRDIMRHRSRTAMSLIGVIGCMMIMIASFGIQDTMNRYLDVYYNESMNYNSRIYIESQTSEDSIASWIDQYDADSSMSINVELINKAVSLDIYDIQEDLVRFTDGTNQLEKLDSNGAYICERIAKEFDLDVGDTFTISPYGQDEEYTFKVAGIVQSVSESVIVSKQYAQENDIQYVPDSLYTKTNKNKIDLETGMSSIQSKQKLMESFDTFLEIMNMMIVILILAGIILGVVVLYNLGVMSYAERYREMATLKVLGFKDKKIGRLLIGQNLWVTIVGILFGIPLGTYVLDILLDALASEYELTRYISVYSYLISIGLTLGVSLLVSLLVARKNKKIDMVEALKNNE